MGTSVPRHRPASSSTVTAGSASKRLSAAVSSASRGDVPIVSEFADGGGAVDEFDGALSGEVLPASELNDDIGDEFTCGVCV